MKIYLITLLSLMFAGEGFAGEQMEQEFLDRIRSFTDAADLSVEQLDKIWIYGETPHKEIMATISRLELLALKGIEKIEFADIYPNLKERIENGIEIDCKRYTTNLEPYKMVEIIFKKEVKGTGSGYSFVSGIKDGKLYMIGMSLEPSH